MEEMIIRNLKRIMKERGIGSSYGFIKLGIPSQTIDRILKNGSPTLKTLWKLADALEVNITEFFRNEEEVK